MLQLQLDKAMNCEGLDFKPKTESKKSLSRVNPIFYSDEKIEDPHTNNAVTRQKRVTPKNCYSLNGVMETGFMSSRGIGNSASIDDEFITSNSP